MYVPDIHAFYVSCGLRLMLEIPIEYEGININVIYILKIKHILNKNKKNP